MYKGVYRIQLNANYTGAGRIYWTEKNTVSQAFYGTLKNQDANLCLALLTGVTKFSKVSVPVIKAPQYIHKTTGDFTAVDFNMILVGMEVEHQRFGIGKVLQLEGNSKDKMATIFFQNNVGQKKIMLRYAKLRIVKSDLMQENS